MSRKYREMPQHTKEKISFTMKHRPPFSDQHKANISKGLKAYWETIPSKPTENKSVSDGEDGLNKKN